MCLHISQKWNHECMKYILSVIKILENNFRIVERTNLIKAWMSHIPRQLSAYTECTIWTFNRQKKFSRKVRLINTRTDSNLFIPKLWEAHETVFTIRYMCLCVCVYIYGVKLWIIWHFILQDHRVPAIKMKKEM